jgi:hypothetical protein
LPQTFYYDFITLSDQSSLRLKFKYYNEIWLVSVKFI